MTAHQFLAPSSALQWAHCTASPHVIRQFAEKPPHQRTIEGNAAHWVLSESFVQNIPCENFLGQQAPNGLMIDDEMVDGATIARADILQTINRRSNALDVMRTLLIEHRVKMPQIHEENGGTLDAACFDAAKGVLFIWDYKHGHRQVNAFQNWQLIDYVAGLVNHFNLHTHDDSMITVCMRVVNPFAYRPTGPIDEWVCKLSDLRPYFNHLINAANEVFKQPTLRTGEHCRDCVALSTCSAARQACYNSIDVITEQMQFDAMSNNALSIDVKIMRSAFSMFKARVEALEEETLARIKRGESMPGFTTENGMSNLDWVVDNAQVKAAAAMFNVAVEKETLLTPVQSIKACNEPLRGAWEQVVKQLAGRKNTGLKLVDAVNSRKLLAFRKEDI